MELFVGTGGYSYKEWKGPFYPKDMPATRMLRFYSERFRTVESNHTFYRMPTGSSLEKSAAETPVNFRFVLKAPQRITHIQRLKDTSGLVSQFLEAAAALKGRLGPLLFQLPPNMKKDAARLREFLTLLPAPWRVALEFRHPSWFDEEVFGVLRGHGAAMCIAEAEGGAEVPFHSTADWGYLRLRQTDYADADLKAWAGRVRRQKWRDAFVFFKHDDEGRAPQLAKRFLELAT